MKNIPDRFSSFWVEKDLILTGPKVTKLLYLGLTMPATSVSGKIVLGFKTTAQTFGIGFFPGRLPLLDIISS